MEVVQDMTEKELKSVKMATIYELRLTIQSQDKQEYTKDDVLNFLDSMAMAKDQEM